MNDRVANFGEQVGTLLPRLRRFARALTRHPQDADDLVQLAVERALTRSTQWRPDSSLTNWMLAIVRNAWIDETRVSSVVSENITNGQEWGDYNGIAAGPNGGRSRARWDGCRRSNGSPWRWC